MTVSTLDSESSDPNSNRGGTYAIASTIFIQMFTALHEIGRRVLLVACCCDQRCGLEGSEGRSHFCGVIVSGLERCTPGV